MAEDSKTADPEAAPAPRDADGTPGTRHDDLDPELLALPRPPTARIGPLMALSLIVFCLYLMYRLHADLRFSRHGEEPRSFDTPAELLTHASSETLVRVPAVPDRTAAVKIAHSAADEGSRLAPLQGTDGTLWVMVSGSVWQAEIRDQELYEGRLRRLADLPFHDELAQHLRARGPQPRFVKAEAARAALDARTTTVRDPAGDTIPVAPDTAVHLHETVADQARIQVFPTERHPGEPQWTAALAELGLIAPDAQATPGQKDSLIYIARIPGGAEAAQAALRTARLYGVHAEAVRVTHRTTWSTLASQGETLVAGDQRLPWHHLTWISLDVPRHLPEDARVIVTLDRPETYWYVTPVFVLLGLFTLLFAWALARSLRDELARALSREPHATTPAS